MGVLFAFMVDGETRIATPGANNDSRVGGLLRGFVDGDGGRVGVRGLGRPEMFDHWLSSAALGGEEGSEEKEED